MVLHLAEHLEVPLRERNTLLLAAGYAPVYAEHPLEAARWSRCASALDRFLRAHEPYPAIVLDRRYELVASNDASRLLTARRRRGSARAAGQRPAPDPPSRGHGAADPQPRRVERAPARAPAAPGAGHGRPVAGELYEELTGYPGCRAPDAPRRHRRRRHRRFPCGCARASASSRSSAPSRRSARAVDITLAELSIEAFYPANAATAERLLADISS